MCVFFLMLLAGPRVAGVFWWIFAPGRWDAAFSSAIWPILGILIVPWTTLMFVSVAPFGNVEGWDWMWLGLGFFADLAMHASSGYSNRNRVPGYSGSY